MFMESEQHLQSVMEAAGNVGERHLNRKSRIKKNVTPELMFKGL